MFWIPLLALVAAMSSDSSEASPQPMQADPMGKTIFDILSEDSDGKVFRQIIQQLAESMESGQIQTYEDSARMLARMGLGDPATPTFAKTGVFVHALAKAEKHRAIWVLDDEAQVALEHTNPPWEFVRNKLPRMPFPAMLIRLARPMDVLTREIPIPISVSSLLLIEEIPERKWRYIGFNSANRMDKVVYTQGWFDVGSASAKAQLVAGEGVPDDGDYRLTGEDVVWQLLLNLMLALEHHHLDGQYVRPKMPRGLASRKWKKRNSVDPYTIVRLSQATREAQSERQSTQDRTPQGHRPQRRHLRRGHWKTQWKGDAGDSPIYAVKPRLNSEGEPTGEYLYKVAIWIFPYWAGVQDGPDSPALYKVKR